MKFGPILAAAVAALPSPGADNLLTRTPLWFEPAGGGFAIRGAGAAMRVEADGLPGQLRFTGARRDATLEPMDRLPGVSNYYLGNDASRWRERVPHYARVRARGVYPGIDAIYYGNAGKLEFDFVVAPGADPGVIELSRERGGALQVDAAGGLQLASAKLRRPRVYQDVAGRRVEIEGGYRVSGGAAKFALADYDRSKPLVIDPILVFETFIGGTYFDYIYAMTLDHNGAILVTGETVSADLRLEKPADPLAEFREGFVAKLAADGKTLLYATFLGGGAADLPSSIAVDEEGNAAVGGTTESRDFPTKGAGQSRFGGVADGFVTRLAPDGAMLASTYWGGARRDAVKSVAANRNGVFAAAETQYLDSPLAIECFVLRFDANGSSNYAKPVETRTAAGIALDPAGAVYVAGTTADSDVLVAKLNPTTDRWIYTKRFGGSKSDSARGIAVDSGGRAYVAGSTTSHDFPATRYYGLMPDRPSWAGGFVAVVDAAGEKLEPVTVMSSPGAAASIATGPGGSFAVAGMGSFVFPLPGASRVAYSPTGSGGAIFATFRADGTIDRGDTWGSSFADGAAAVAMDATDAVYIAGHGVPPSFRGTTQPDGFVAKFTRGPEPVVVTLRSDPVGRLISVDGHAVRTPYALPWLPGSVHTLDAGSNQTDHPFVYSFSRWSSGAPSRHTYTVPPDGGEIAALFTKADCTLVLPPSPRNTFTFERSRGVAAVSLEGDRGCQLGPVPSPEWIRLLPPEDRDPMQAAFEIAPNPGPPRSARVAVAGAFVEISQSGGKAALRAPEVVWPEAVVRTGVPEFRWAPVEGAAVYEIVVAYPGSQPDSDGFQGYRAVTRTAGVQLAAPSLPSRDWEVWIRACAAEPVSDETCGESALGSVKTDVPGFRGQATLTFPPPGVPMTVSANPIQWSPVPGASSYLLTIASGSLPVFRTRTDATREAVVLPSGFYGVEVAPCTVECGATATGSFPFLSPAYMQVALPPKPTGTPAGLLANAPEPGRLEVSWRTVPGADLYRVTVRSGEELAAARVLEGTSVTLAAPAGPARVTVQACNGNGCGPESAGAGVEVAGPGSPVPVLASPIGTVVADGPLTFVWNRVEGDDGAATEYRLYVQNMAERVPVLEVTTRSNRVTAHLAPGYRYDAFVTAIRDGAAVQGPVSPFVVSPPASNIRTWTRLMSPARGATLKTGPVRLTWTPAGQHYEYAIREAASGRSVAEGTLQRPAVEVSLPPGSYVADVRACMNVPILVPNAIAGSASCLGPRWSNWSAWASEQGEAVEFEVVP